MIHCSDNLPPEPRSEIYISCEVDSFSGRERRDYFLSRSPANEYNSSISGGQSQYTFDDQGPNGEEIVRRVEWHMSYIGYFESWETVKAFFRMLRAKSFQWME